VDVTAGESLPALRLSASSGVNVPVGDYHMYEPSTTFAVGVDVPINESGLFGGIGFATYGFNGEELTEDHSVSALFAGMQFSFVSAVDPVVPYVNLSLGIDATSWDVAYLIVGLGADFNLSKRFALFIEASSVFPTPPSRLGWIPVRAGLRFLVPS
jgi:hypothetical protein